MKVTVLLAHCDTELLLKSIELIMRVLGELEIKAHQVALHQLPYYSGKKTSEIEGIMQSIRESKGVVAISKIPMLGLHGALQSFFDQATLYEKEYFNKPMLAVTCSEWLGEQDAARMIQKYWHILGGIEGGSVYMHTDSPEGLSLERLEKETENFYRLLKQQRANVDSSERKVYEQFKQRKGQSQESYFTGKQDLQVKNFAAMIKGKEQDFSSIKERTSEANSEIFISRETGLYTRPTHIKTGVVGPKKLQQIPHYFVMQYDKTLQAIIRYELTDLKEQGYIIIKDGDCSYKDTVQEMSTVEIILTESILQEILAKKITYQKAFMIGKLKVKGNFALLPKLDQAFKGIQ